jgi:putative transposase
MSNEIAYGESIFRKCKYRPNYPYKGVLTLANAREGVWRLYIGIIASKNDDKNVTVQRKALYEGAKNKYPECWSGKTRNWELPKKSTLISKK